MSAIANWKALIIIVGLIVLAASLNIIVRRLAPIRFDTTAGQVFTLSEGTLAVLDKAKASGRPVTLRLFVSGEETQLPKELTEYAKRVEDLLEEYSKASGESVVIQTYSPVPNSVEEDAAVLDGIQSRDPLMDMEQTDNLDDIDFNRRGAARERYFFGLSISSLENIETIPFLDPTQEANLEYKITRAIASVTRKEKLKIGLLEGNEIGMAGQPSFMGGRGAPPWTIYRYLERDFEMVSVPFDVQPMEPGDKNHPFFDLDLLLIVHPVKINRPQSPQPGMPPIGTTTVEPLSTETQYAVDQFLVNGGKVLAFLDNQYMVSRYFDAYSTVLPFARRSDNPAWLKDLMNLFDSSAMPDYRSGLDELYSAWGVKVGGPGTQNPVLIDPKYSRPVAYPRPVNSILQREFRLVSQLRNIPDQRWTQSIVQAMERGAAIMADFSDDALAKDNPVTGNLSSVRMVDPGVIEGKPANGLKMRTLVHSSPKAKALPGEQVGFMLGVSRTLEEAMAQLQASNAPQERYPVAVELTGKFKSAFDEDPTIPEEPEEPEEPAAPPVAPPLLPPGAPDSVVPPPAPSAPDPAPAPDATTPTPAPEPVAPAPDAPAPPPAPDATTPAPDPAPAPGEPEEGSYQNPQSPDPADAAPDTASPETAPETSAPDPDADADAAVTPPAGASEQPAPAPTDATPDAAALAPPKEEEKKSNHKNQGTEEGALIIVSDVDMLFDFFLGDPDSRGGQRSHDNLAFVFNLVETLAGDKDLVNVRGRGSTHRPFTVINDIRAKASAKQSAKRADIREKMEEANKALMAGQLVLTQEGELEVQMDAERAEKLEKAQSDLRELEQQQRLINREERKEIQAAITSYKSSNMLFMPTIVVLLGFGVALIRKFRTAAR